MSKLQPSILGSGTAGRALRMALAMFPGEVGEPRQLERGAPLPDPDPGRSLLVVANPHGLHTQRLVEAAELGYRWAISEKPAAVSLEQVEQLEQLARLEDVRMQVWICHGYRLLWGPQELRRAWVDGRFGEVMTVEGRYWQSSAARGGRASGWKDDPALAGNHDVLLDLATHWADLAIFLTGEAPGCARIRRWYGNAASEHRDTHVHVTLEHGGTTSFGSVSKTVHGAGNHLEVTVVGTDASATWSLAEPDVIVWGRGSERSTQVRATTRPPAHLPPFHGMGWLGGYVSLVGDLVGHVCHGRRRTAPSLEEQIVVLRSLLDAAEAERRERDSR